MVLGFNLSHAGTVPNPFSYIEETTFGTMPTSPTLTATKVTNDIRMKIDDMEMDVRQVGSHLLYGMQSGGHSYGFGLTFHPFDLPFLKIGTEQPNYSSPSGTSAASYSFALRYKQATGTAALTDHYIKFLGCKPNTTEVSVSSQGLVEASQEWIAREITKPTATPISGATWPTFNYTTPVLSNVDGGEKPLTINGTQYAVKDFRISWNNNLIADQFSGSGLVDALTVGAIEVSGSFSTPVGQDLLLETAIQDFPQATVNASYVVKSGTMVINMVGLKLITDTPEGFQAGPTSTFQHVYNFRCFSASVGTS